MRYVTVMTLARMHSTDRVLLQRKETDDGREAGVSRRKGATTQRHGAMRPFKAARVTGTEVVKARCGRPMHGGRVRIGHDSRQVATIERGSHLKVIVRMRLIDGV
jgi:hypothetical protein